VSETPDAPHEGAGHGLKATLGKKVGPLPMGVWILAVGGGLVLTWYMRRNAAPTTATDTSTDTTAPDTGGTGTGSWPYGVPNGVGQTGSTGSDSGNAGPFRSSWGAGMSPPPWTALYRRTSAASRSRRHSARSSTKRSS
jgi:hypothetical protein